MPAMLKKPAPKPAAAGQQPAMFTSLISTAAPLSPSVSHSVARHPQAFRGFSGSGDLSRDAAARAMADMSRNALDSKVDAYNRGYRAKAEKALADDRFAQYQTQLGRYSMGKQKQQLKRQQDMQFRQGLDQISQYRNLARQRARMQLLGDITGAVAGTNLLGRFSKPIGEGLAGGASMGFTGQQNLGRAGLLGNLMSWYGPQ